MLNCDQVAVLLDAFRTAELSTDQQSEVGAHLKGCPNCRSMLEEIRSTAAALNAVPRNPPRSILDAIAEALGDRLGAVDTVLGPVWVGFNDRGLTFVSLGHADPSDALARYERRLGRQVVFSEVPAKLARAVVDAAEGRWSKDVPVDLEGLPSFERTVLERLRTIPRGEVRPYAWLAAESGSPRAVRAVGNVMNRNPIPLILPCHRVVPSTGGVGNYAFGSDVKRTLLEREGVSTEHIDELARRRVRYIGTDTTRIYCYPTCRDARRIHPEHQVTFQDEHAADAAGYRPCKHCRPLAAAV